MTDLLRAAYVRFVYLLVDSGFYDWCPLLW